MTKKLRIGTRDSQLAVWQATHVQQLLEARGIATELVYIKSEGDINTTTPLYEMGVQGIFTKALDIALLSNQIDIAVHSMKDVPVALAKGLKKAAVLERASYLDILVYKHDTSFLDNEQPATIATSSIRRIAQWLHKYPAHRMVSFRGNVNTRLRKLEENNWNGAIFAAAGLERIGLRPAHSINLNWMLPAPAQGAIMVVCRADDNTSFHNTCILDHKATSICTHIEREFLKTLQGGCSTPVSALAVIENGEIRFSGNIASHDGTELLEVHETCAMDDFEDAGHIAAMKLLTSGLPWIQQVLKKK
ncbi:MAG TPA: hydroxymethylbilane synthase [Chitinophagaceae bacterium]|nr:hydroxymethylbilane synthase [Chitinophagaceae bacterium]